MYYRLFDEQNLTTQYVDELGTVIDDIGDADFEDVPSQDDALALVRMERNARLSACDWTQLADVPLTSSDVTKWRIYRQELRDMMTGFAWNLSTWPIEP